MHFALGVFLLASVALAQQKLCGREEIAGPKDGFIINNNLWGEDSGSGHQCTTVDHISQQGVGWQTTWQWSGDAYSVKSYANSGLDLKSPKLVKSIKKIPTTATWSYNNTKGAVADVAYDCFTAAQVTGDTSKGDFELMVWLAKYGDDSKIQPIGTKLGAPSIGGHHWELWGGAAEGTSMKTYSFVAHGTVNHYHGDLMQFFDYLTKHHGFPAQQQHLLTVQFGTEPKTGGEATMKVSNWSASVN